MLIDWLLPNVAKKVSKFYWMTSDRVHGDTSWDAYNFYYSKIKEIMNPLNINHHWEGFGIRKSGSKKLLLMLDLGK